MSGGWGQPVVAWGLPRPGAPSAPGTAETYEPGDARDLAAAILRLVDDPADRAARVDRTLELVRELAWERESIRYRALVDRLAEDGPASPVPGGSHMADA